MGKIAECKTKLNAWLQRDLTIFGRTYLTKMESLSRLIYPSYSMAIPNRFIKDINQLNFNFIWKNRVHYIKKAEIIKEYKDGGVQAIDFECLNAVLKLKWIKSFLLNPESIWFCLPRGLFKRVGGLDFLLKCDFKVERLPVKLSSFHKQMLCWKLMYTHNFTPHQTPIWNNRYVLCNRKSLFLQDWMDKNIWSVTHFLDEQGNWLTFENFSLKYDLNCTRAQFNKVSKAIPAQIKLLVQNIRSDNINLPALHIEGRDFLMETTNKILRSHMNNILYPARSNRNSIMQLFSEADIKKWRTHYISYPVSPKAKEVHFRILNNVYPSNELLRKRFNIDQNNCSFCNVEIETTEHIFFDCSCCMLLWEDLQDWLSSKIPLPDPLTRENIIFGVRLEDSSSDLVLNNIIVLAKYFIHCSKWRKSKPYFSVFKNEVLNAHLVALKAMRLKPAKSLLAAYEELDIFMD